MPRLPKAIRLAASALLLAAAGAASAADTQNLTVSASVQAVCKFSSAVQTLSFGSLDPSNAVAANGTGAAVTYKCTKGTAATGVTAGNGNNFSGGSRRMTNGTDFIPYTLTISGGTQTGLGFSAAGNLNLTVAGTVAANSYTDVSAGNYTDTVVLTIAP